METVLIQINNNKAYKLLEDLEDLQIITLVEKNSKPKQLLSEKFGGKLNLTEKEYTDFQKYLKDVRNEWDRNIL